MFDYFDLMNIVSFIHCLAGLHTCQRIHSNRVSNSRQNFLILNNQGLDFSDEFTCSDVQFFGKIHILSTNIIELSF